MEHIRQMRDVEEPIGIVIADGARREVTPRFAAFVWAPAPEPAAADAAQEPRAA